MKFFRLLCVSLALAVCISTASVTAPTVAANLSATGIEIDFGKTNMQGVVTHTYNVAVKVTPLNATPVEVQLYALDSDLATVTPEKAVTNSEGKAHFQVTLHKVGVTTLSAKTTDGRFSSSRTMHITPENPFSLETDTWPVINSYSGFQHSATYKIPYARYQELYGASAETYYNLVGNRDWSGNCFGMCFTAVMNFTGYYKLPGIQQLSADGFSGAKESGLFSKKTSLYLEESSTLAQIIEYYQLFEKTPAYETLTSKSAATNVPMQEFLALALRRETPVIIGLSYRSGGHCLVTDYSGPASRLKFLDDGWYAIPVYDPNMPYYANPEGYTLAENYSQAQERYFYINPQTGEWKFNGSLNAGITAQWHGKTNGSIRDGIRLDLIRLDTLAPGKIPLCELPTSPTQSSAPKQAPLSLAGGGETWLFDSSAMNLTIVDTKTQKQLLEVKNYEVKTLDDKLKYRFTTGEMADADASVTPAAIISIPAGQYSITMENGVFAARGMDNMNIVSVSGCVSFDLDEKNDAVALTAKSDTDYTLVQENIFTPDEFTAVQLTGSLTQGQSVSTTLDDDDNFTASSNDSIVADMEITGDTADNPYTEANVSISTSKITDLQKRLGGTAENKPSTQDVTQMFTDVTGHWATSYIQTIVDEHILLGTGNAQFSPNVPLSRGMFITALYRLAGSPQVTQASSFPDAKQGDYYAAAARWAEDNGIVSGNAEGLLLPQKNISREEMAVILYRYLQTQTTLLTSNPSQFADASAISPWASQAVDCCVSEGLIVGRPQNGAMLFAPQSNATRAEACVVLSRLLSKLS